MGASTILPGGGTARQSKHISTDFGHGEAIFLFIFSFFMLLPLSPRAALVVFVYKALLGWGSIQDWFWQWMLAAWPEALGPPRQPGRGGSAVPPSRREGKARVSG